MACRSRRGMLELELLTGQHRRARSTEEYDHCAMNNNHCHCGNCSSQWQAEPSGYNSDGAKEFLTSCETAMQTSSPPRMQFRTTTGLQSGSYLLVRCSKSKWHHGEVTRISSSAIRVWIRAVKCSVDIPIELADSHLKTAGYPEQSGSDGRGFPKSNGTLQQQMHPSSPPLKAFVQAVRPAHLAHRQMYQHVSTERGCTICNLPLNFDTAQLAWQCGHRGHFVCAGSNVEHGITDCPQCSSSTSPGSRSGSRKALAPIETLLFTCTCGHTCPVMDLQSRQLSCPACKAPPLSPKMAYEQQQMPASPNGHPLVLEEEYNERWETPAPAFPRSFSVPTPGYSGWRGSPQQQQLHHHHQHAQSLQQTRAHASYNNNSGSPSSSPSYGSQASRAGLRRVLSLEQSTRSSSPTSPRPPLSPPNGCSCGCSDEASLSRHPGLLRGSNYSLDSGLRVKTFESSSSSSSGGSSGRVHYLPPFPDQASPRRFTPPPSPPLDRGGYHSASFAGSDRLHASEQDDARWQEPRAPRAGLHSDDTGSPRKSAFSRKLLAKNAAASSAAPSAASASSNGVRPPMSRRSSSLNEGGSGGERPVTYVVENAAFSRAMLSEMCSHKKSKSCQGLVYLQSVEECVA
eukprot:jgi/Mesen1/8596/ME000005S08557